MALDEKKQLSRGDIVEVDCKRDSDVFLMKSIEYSKYKKGQAHKSEGGKQKKTPAQIKVPSTGMWHIVSSDPKAKYKVIKG